MPALARTLTPLAITLAATLTLAACLAPLSLPEPSARRDFQDYCAACHGDGTSAGPLAQEMGLKPSALAFLQRNNKGVFPAARVMSKVVGYTRNGVVMGAKTGEMPSFEVLAEGPVVLYDSGDGIQTPTPLRLVELMEYIKTLQK